MCKSTCVVPVGLCSTISDNMFFNPGKHFVYILTKTFIQPIIHKGVSTVVDIYWIHDKICANVARDHQNQGQVGNKIKKRYSHENLQNGSMAAMFSFLLFNFVISFVRCRSWCTCSSSVCWRCCEAVKAQREWKLLHVQQRMWLQKFQSNTFIYQNSTRY